MPRRRGQDGNVTRLRESNEAALLALVDCLEVMPFIHLRLQQAMQRFPLSDLLGPADQDLRRLSRDIVDARLHIEQSSSRLAQGLLAHIKD